MNDKISEGRLNTEPPNEALMKGFQRGAMVLLPNPMPALRSWTEYLKRIAAEGHASCLEGCPVCAHQPKPMVLKGRTDGAKQFAIDYSADLKFTDLDWRPRIAMQAESRVRRKISLNAIRLPKAYASRNEREGVYAFKVNGKHTRKKRPHKIEVLELGADALQQIKELSSRNQGTRSDS